MSTWSALQIVSSTANAHDSTALTYERISCSFLNIPNRRSTSFFAHQVVLLRNVGLRTSFAFDVSIRSTNPAGRYGLVRVRQPDGCLKICCGRSFSLRSLRRRGSSRLERQRSSLASCSEQRTEISSGEVERNTRASERTSEGKERTSNKGRGVRASGQRLEVRLLQRLNQTIEDRHLFVPGENILLAVSGGQDSVCLMHLLVKLQRRWGWKIGIAHCDHQWSSSAREQAAHVAQVAQRLGLDYYQALTVETVSGEGLARTWRYGVLQRIAVSHGYEAIVTAHTASDRVETSLFNVFRGSGLQGLQSLTWKRSLSPGLCLSCKSAFQLTKPVERVEDPLKGTLATSKSSISLIRPLLDVTRTELRELREELSLPLWPDPSNASVDIDRNRIRHQLLPYLRKYFNLGVDKSLARWVEILHGEQAYLESLCESITSVAVSKSRQSGDDITSVAVSKSRQSGDDEVERKLDISILRSVPVALQRRILKRFSDGFTGKSLGFDIVEHVRQSCVDPSSRRKGLKVSVPGNCFLAVHDENLVIARCPDRRIQK